MEPPCSPGLALGSSHMEKCLLCKLALSSAGRLEVLTPSLALARALFLRLPDSTWGVWVSAEEGSQRAGWGPPPCPGRSTHGTEQPRVPLSRPGLYSTKGLAFITKSASLDLNTSKRLEKE